MPLKLAQELENTFRPTFDRFVAELSMLAAMKTSGHETAAWQEGFRAGTGLDLAALAVIENVGFFLGGKATLSQLRSCHEEYRSALDDDSSDATRITTGQQALQLMDQGARVRRRKWTPGIGITFAEDGKTVYHDGREFSWLQEDFSATDWEVSQIEPAIAAVA